MSSAGSTILQIGAMSKRRRGGTFRVQPARPGWAGYHGNSADLIGLASRGGNLRPFPGVLPTTRRWDIDARPRGADFALCGDVSPGRVTGRKPGLWRSGKSSVRRGTGVSAPGGIAVGRWAEPGDIDAVAAGAGNRTDSDSRQDSGACHAPVRETHREGSSLLAVPVGGATMATVTARAGTRETGRSLDMSRRVASSRAWATTMPARPPRLRRDGEEAPRRDGPPPAEAAGSDRFPEIPSGTGSARPSRREALKRGIPRHCRRTGTASPRQRAATGRQRGRTVTDRDVARGPGTDVRRRPFGAIGGVQSIAGMDRDGQESSRSARYLRIPGWNSGNTLFMAGSIR